MKPRTASAVFITLVLTSVSTLALAEKKTEKIERTFRFKDPNGQNLLVVDNVFGDIVVKGYDGDEVRMVVHKTVEARSEKKLQAAEENVRLDIAAEDDLVDCYVDGPFRCSRGRSIRWRGCKHEGYRVRFDFEITVPKNTRLDLKTVNDGEIAVTNVQGDYTIKNVNGEIAMDRVAGSGDVYAVNGDVSVDFQQNPQDSCRFGSLNGDLRITFRPNLSADFHLKTFNGQVYSDFPVTSIAVPPKVFSKEKRGKHVYKIDRKTAVRAGNGGPVILLDGFNGDMFILGKK